MAFTAAGALVCIIITKMFIFSWKHIRKYRFKKIIVESKPIMTVPMSLNVIMTNGRFAECPICFDEYDGIKDLMLLPCSHLMHHDCVIPWFLRRHDVHFHERVRGVTGEPQCPVCREGVPRGPADCIKIQSRRCPKLDYKCVQGLCSCDEDEIQRDLGTQGLECVVINPNPSSADDDEESREVRTNSDVPSSFFHDAFDVDRTRTQNIYKHTILTQILR